MTEAGWTREIGESGWYWWRLDDGQLQIVYVSMGGTVSIFGVGKRSLKRLDGEFKGPITPDSCQQGRVAGLREAVPLACKYCNDRTKWTPMSNSGYHVCKHMPEPGFVRCQAIKIHAALAQQAQEGGVGDADTHVIS